ncbi:hypothetical protein ACF0H5_005732 [Mactra antiquata]
METNNLSQSMEGEQDISSFLGNYINTLKWSWKQFDLAGSQCLVQLCSSLHGSQYDIVTKEIVALLGPVFGCSESELVLGRIKEVESLMSGLLSQAEEGTRSPAEHQMALRCLLLFVKLQAEYHQLCSNLVSSAVDHLIVTCEDQENSELCQQIQSLQLKSFSNLSNTNTRQTCLKKAPTYGGNSPKLHKHGLKASLFSLFERKNSPEEGKSSFYVDIDEKTENKDSGATDQSGVMSYNDKNLSQSEVLIEVGLDPSPSSVLEPEVSSAKDKKGTCAVSPNGYVATQEELDNVIDLLSGVGMNRGTMQTIPESRNQVNLKVPPPASALSPATSDSLDERTSPLRNKTQRRSEGSLDFTGFTYTGHSTWPNHHRASLPGGQLGAPSPQITYDFASTPTQQPSFGSSGYRPTTLPPGGAGHFQSSYGMGFPDPKLNRTWPVNNLAGSGSVMDTINSSWSGGQDSDDLSDDSSVGEQFQQMSNIQYNELRRDMFENKDGRYVQEDRTGEVKHHSLEDLLDGRSNTWPQQLQPWSHAHLGAELVGPHDQMAYHRPISMQMSDPLSRRNIWQNTGAEFPLHPSQSQTVHGGLGNM